MAGENKIEDLTQDIRNLLLVAYRRGYRDGVQAVRDSVIRATDVPVDDVRGPVGPWTTATSGASGAYLPFASSAGGGSTAHMSAHVTAGGGGGGALFGAGAGGTGDPSSVLPMRKPEGAKRAPRGVVEDVIRASLGIRPGQTTVELEKAGEGAGLSAKSIGNQLRRLEGVLYERDGRRWFLRGQKGSSAASDEVTADDVLGPEPKGGGGE